jgi:hypothetical protein
MGGSGEDWTGLVPGPTPGPIPGPPPGGGASLAGGGAAMAGAAGAGAAAGPAPPNRISMARNGSAAGL